MIRRPPRSTRTDTLFPYTTLFRSQRHDRLILVHQIGEAGQRPQLGLVGDVGEDIVALNVRRPVGRTELAAVYAPDGPRRNRVGQVDLQVLDPHIFDAHGIAGLRSEERRVGKECVSTGRSRWSPYD